MPCLASRWFSLFIFYFVLHVSIYLGSCRSCFLRAVACRTVLLHTLTLDTHMCKLILNQL